MRRLTGTETVDDLDDYLAAVDTIASETRCTVQVFDARYVVDETHLRRALRLADRAFDRGENVARDRGVEILLYAAGRRQIDRALEMGVSEGTTPVVALVAADETPVRETSDETRRDDRDSDARERRAVDRLRERPSFEPGPVAPEPDRVRAFFDVTDRELAATDGDLTDVVHERVALLDVEK
jgi:KEOPS complex subunit Cgi121